MKPADIRRGIESPKRRDHDPGGPKLGKLARLRHSEFLTGRKRKRKRGKIRNSELKNRVRIVSTVIGLASLVVIGLAFSIWLAVQLDRDSVTGDKGKSVQEEDVRVASKFPSPSREEALELVRLAIENRDPTKIPSFFRCGSASTETILKFLDGMVAKDGPIQRYEWLSRMDKEGLPVEGVLVEAKGESGPLQRLALLTPDTSGKWQVDFNAFARTCSPSWDELLVKGADQGVVRVFVGKAVYYNGPFRDEFQWVCYGMVSPDTEEVLLGYCRVESKVAATLKKLLSEGEKMRRATLEIRRVKESEPRQFEIIRVLAQDWILGEAPDEHSIKE